MNKFDFKIVLFQPEIPGNTGSIGRTCVALGVELILIKPYGFDISEKAVRRAGLDYWKYIELSEFNSWQEFMLDRQPQSLVFFENYGDVSFHQKKYDEGVYLIFGSETKGLPNDMYEKYKDDFVCLPMYSEHIRSLNLSNVVTTAAYQCLGNQLGDISF